ncbi:MAG: acyl--CoA ligase [Acidimicrobiia bacterium]|nr:acyl--CoA ligase [Acidimicrobiia bacterium]
MSVNAVAKPGSATSPARLEWSEPEGLPDEVRAALTGPGAPFELRRQVVAGFEREVFVNQPRNLRQLLEGTVARQPDLPFLVTDDRVWTFAEALDEVDSMARYLAVSHGIAHGDRVAIVAANSPEYGFAMLATLSLGAIVTSLNGWWTGPEMNYGIELTEPKVVLGDGPRLARLADRGIGVPQVLLTEARAAGQELNAPDVEPVADVAPDDPAVILFTSGTTGKPKGATLSHRNIIHFVWANLFTGSIGAMTGPAPDPTGPPARSQPASILTSPMFHVSGMLGILMMGSGMGGKLIFAPPGRWNPADYLRLTAEHGVSTWSGVPTQFWRLLRDPEFASYDLTRVASAGGGGAVFPPELAREFQARMPGASLGNGYGMSETVGIGTRIGGDDMLQYPDSVGPANVTVEVEIRDETGSPLAQGDVGEIYLRTAAIFLGYWNNDDATRECIDDDGWYRTGDYGRVQDGRLYLESRMRDMILRGGENIYPIEIENRLVEHADIDDAAVIGVDHPELGQEVKAFVILRDGATLTVGEVQSWVAEALARFKVPETVEFRTNLPYTETGKVMKHELEAEERAKAGQQ